MHNRLTGWGAIAYWHELRGGELIELTSSDPGGFYVVRLRRTCATVVVFCGPDDP